MSRRDTKMVKAKAQCRPGSKARLRLGKGRFGVRSEQRVTTTNEGMKKWCPKSKS